MRSLPFYRTLYGQVLIATAAGVLVGHFYPEAGLAMRPLGDGFIKLIRMIIAPIIFCTVVVGIAGVGDMKAVGKGGALISRSRRSSSRTPKFPSKTTQCDVVE